MGQAKRSWVTVGSYVTMRKTGERVQVLEFRGSEQADRLRVQMSNGREQWVTRKEIRVPA
jgi:hypothetical protein